MEMLSFTNAGSMDLRGLDLGSMREVCRVAWKARSVTPFRMQLTRALQCLLTNSPKHLIQASLSVPLVKQKVFASMDLQYLSNRETLAGQYSGAYAITNFTLFSRNVFKGWEASAGLYNAFNRNMPTRPATAWRRTPSSRMAELFESKSDTDIKFQ